MTLSRGNISFYSLFRADEIGVAKEPNLDRLVKVFLQVSEGIAARWIQMPNGLLLFVMVPGDPASGAFYLYDKAEQEFSLICFEDAGEIFTEGDFDNLIEEYMLVDCASNPTLFKSMVQPTGTA